MGLGGLFGSSGDYYKSLNSAYEKWVDTNDPEPFKGIDLMGDISPELSTKQAEWMKRQPQRWDQYMSSVSPEIAQQTQSSFADHNASLAKINKIGSALAKGTIGAIAGAGALSSLGGLGGAGTSSAPATLADTGLNTAIEGGYNAGAGSLGGVSGWTGPAGITTVGGLDNLAAPAVAGTAASGGSAMQNFFKSLGIGAPAAATIGSALGKMSIPGVISSIADLYVSNKTNKNLNNLYSSLTSLYGPNSAYAQQLKQELERKDAAAGRRSQYGPREVELQAKLADAASRNASTLAGMNMNMDRSNTNLVNSLLNLGNYSGAFSGLQNLFSPQP